MKKYPRGCNKPRGHYVVKKEDAYLSGNKRACIRND